MSFTSPAFFLFVLVLVPVYYLAPKRSQWIILLIASYAFYLFGSVKAVFYLVFTTITTYTAGLLLDRLNRRRAHLAPEEKTLGAKRIKRQKKAVIVCALLMSFGLLYLVKYWNFTAELLSGITGAAVPGLNLLVPLGLSFYLFQSVGYVIDIYRGKYEAQASLPRFALFVSFFPQIIQGPISRYDQLAPQLLARRSVNWDHLKYGIQLAMWGYFKKLIIAERIGVAANTVFADNSAYGGAVLAVGVLAYCIQLYCDFSGGIDITRGVAQMLGIDLIENFRRPIFSQSLTEFWRRWHISLGGWLRDYLFFSLSLSKPFARLGKWARKHIPGKAGKILATSLATFIVYFVIGVWHGANWRYIAFGFYNGLIITASLLLEDRFIRLRQIFRMSDHPGWRLFRMGRTALLVFIGRYITRAPRLLVGVDMLWRTVFDCRISQLWDGSLLTLGITGFDYGVVLSGVAVLLLTEYQQEKGVAIRDTLARKNPLLQWLAIAIPMAVILLFGIVIRSYVPAQFIYAQY